MDYEYAVFDRDGKQMGMPTKSWPEMHGAKSQKLYLEQARARHIAEGQTAETRLAEDNDMKTLTIAERDDLQQQVLLGKQAAVQSYSIKGREVGPWQTI